MPDPLSFTIRFSFVAVAVLSAAALLPDPAQSQGAFTIPPGGVVPNYGRVIIGQEQGLEGNVFVVRAADATANWYNPAGLALSERSGINASANAYEVTRYSVEGVEQKKASTRFNSLGTFVGGVLGSPIIHSALRLGFSYTRPTAWSPGRIEGEIVENVPGGKETFFYGTYANLQTVVPAVNAGLPLGEHVRVGAGLGCAITSLYQNQTISDRLQETAALTTAFRGLETDGQTGSLLVTGGIQADLTPVIHVGAVVTSPGLRIWGSSRITYQATQFSGDGSQDLFFRDEAAKFEYRVPFRAVGGVALVFDRTQVELDVRVHGAEGPYDLYSSTVPARLLTSDAAGVPAESTLAFDPVVEETRVVTSVGVGGRYQISPAVRLHLGVFSDASPVEGESMFREVDLMGSSAGASFQMGKLSASLGLSATWGTSKNRQVGPTLSGTSRTTDVSVRTGNLMYSVSYSF